MNQSSANGGEGKGGEGKYWAVCGAFMGAVDVCAFT